MNSKIERVTCLMIAVLACYPGAGRTELKVASWLDEPKLTSWNRTGLSIPAAPRHEGAVGPRCRDLARPTQLEEDKRLRDQGWDLVGAFQGGWRILVLRGTAGYDGMCRPRQYQDFVFVRGAFAGTLSPKAMDSRTDGSLGRVTLGSDSRLTAEYERYAATDALCCPSKTTSVEFEIVKDKPIVRPVSAFTSSKR
jgi:hypothetical protein